MKKATTIASLALLICTNGRTTHASDCPPPSFVPGYRCPRTPPAQYAELGEKRTGDVDDLDWDEAIEREAKRPHLYVDEINRTAILVPPPVQKISLWSRGGLTPRQVNLVIDLHLRPRLSVIGACYLFRQISDDVPGDFWLDQLSQVLHKIPRNDTYKAQNAHRISNSASR